MRLTPAQLGMHALLGKNLKMGMPSDWSLAQRIRHGHAFLVSISKVDLGLDPEAWHTHLKAGNVGGYRWSNKHLGMPKAIASALANPECQDAVREMNAENDVDPSKENPLPEASC